MGPAGTPQPIVDKLYDETVKVMAQPDVRGKLESLGLQLVGNTPAEFAEIVKQETADVGQGHQGRRHQGGAVAAAWPGRTT